MPCPTRRSLTFGLASLPLLAAGARGAWSRANPPLRVLVISGGHDFEEPAFFAMWDALPGIAWQHARYGGPAEALLSSPLRDVDALVFYDMNGKVGPHCDRMLALARRGLGMVFLHHALGSYPDWGEYSRLVGGHANWRDRISTYQHDVTFRVTPRPGHAITAGLAPFEIEDETYGVFEVRPEVRVLLSTDHPSSGPSIGWSHRYGKAPIVYLQPGHGKTAWRHPTYQQLLGRSVAWVARRPR